MKNLIPQLLRLLLDNQAYHLQKLDGSYPPAKDKILDQAVLERHLKGELTIAPNLVSPEGFARVGMVDFDGGPSHWQYIKTLLAEVKKLGLVPLVSVSGAKGYGVWFVFKEPLPVDKIRTFLRYLRRIYFRDLSKVDLRPDIDKPSMAGEAVIKLPPCLHRKNKTWSAWIDSIAYVNAPPTGFDHPPDMEAQATLIWNNLDKGLIESTSFIQILDRLHKHAGRSDWSRAGPKYKPELKRLLKGHSPPCIEALLKKGVPHNLDYNMANLNLATYAKSRGLTTEEELNLARKVAEASEDHPTSKKTIADKLKNFQSNSSPGSFYCDYPRNIKPWCALFGGLDECRLCVVNPSLSDKVTKQHGFYESSPLEYPVVLDLLAWAWSSEIKLDPFKYALPSVTVDREEVIHFSPASIAARVSNAADYFREVDLWMPEKRVSEGLLALVKTQAKLEASKFLQKLKLIEPNEKAGLAALERAKQIEERSSFYIRLYETTRKGPDIDIGLIAKGTIEVATETLSKKKTLGPLVSYREALFADLACTEIPTVDTPFQQLTALLHGGWRGGRFYVVVAPPKTGKTTFVAHVLDHAALNGHPCLYVGYEMARGQLIDYALARQLSINSRRIETRLLTKEEALKVARGLDHYLHTVGSNLEIWEAGLLTGIADMLGWIERQRLDCPDKTPLVVIDYLQLAQTGIQDIDRHPSETKRVSALAVACKDLARQTGAAVIALSSTTKEAEHASRVDGFIDVTAARDSLAIIHAADGVLTLQTKSINLNKKGDDSIPLDPWEFIAHQASQQGDEGLARQVQTALTREKENYPSPGPGAAVRMRLSLIRHRGSTGHVLIYYRQAFHQMESTGFLDSLLLKASVLDDEKYDPAVVRDVFKTYFNTDCRDTDSKADVTTKKTSEDTYKEESTKNIPNINYNLITNVDEAKALLSSLAGHGEVVGLDLETTGLDPLVSSPRLLQVAAEGEPVFVFDLFQIGGLHALRASLENLHVVAHNATFDMGFLRKAGVKLTPECTMLAAHILTGRMFSLADLVDSYLGWTLDKTEQVSDWGGELTDDQLRYAALDAEAVRQLYPKLLDDIKKRKSVQVYQLMQKAQPAVVDMELAGMPFDRDAQNTMITDLTTKLDDLHTQLKISLNGRNPNSGPQIGEWLTEILGGEASESYKAWSKTSSGRLSTGSDALTKGLRFLPFEAQTLVKNVFLPYKDVAKRVSVYGKNLAKHIHVATNRIHACYNLAGTSTGRFSCSKPNLQNIPRDKSFRRLFRAPEGRVFVICDYSQMELRVASMLAEEHNLLEAYERGDDTHTITASLLLGKPTEEITKEERQIAKAVNFGLLFGQSAKGLREYASSSFGIALSNSKACEYHKAWFKAYPAFKAWHRRLAMESRRAYAVRTPAGRERHFTKKDYRETRAYNTPVQGGAAEVILAALGHFNYELAASGLNAIPVAVVHDEIIVETDQEYAQAVAPLLEDCMISGMLDIFPKAATVGLVDASIGKTWADK